MSLRLNAPRKFVVAAAGTGAGKTLLTAALCAAAVAGGRTVAPFKCGPDYIDGRFYERFTGRAACNVDLWLDGVEDATRLVETVSRDVDIAIFEGMMGLFDGHEDGETSTADIAHALDASVILVLDGWSASQTIAAVALGLALYDPRLNIAGVIVNRVAGDAHERAIRAAFSKTPLPLLACVRYDAAFACEERHLGLDPVAIARRESALHGLAAVLLHESAIAALFESAPGAGGHAYTSAAHSQTSAMARVTPRSGSHITNAPFDLSAVNVPDLGSRAQQSPEDASGEVISDGLRKNVKADSLNSRREALARPKVRIAIAQDEAFWFTYPETVIALENAGAELVPFSPIGDAALPSDVAGIWLSGGYPEVYARELEANVALREELRRELDAGMVCYAECGGMMYLAETLITATGCYTMVGAIDGSTDISEPQLTIGYRRVQCARDTPLDRAGDELRGYEYHYARAKLNSRDAAYRCDDGTLAGVASAHIVASFLHRHFLPGDPAVTRFIASCRSSARVLIGSTT